MNANTSRERRRYSDIEQAQALAALDANGGDVAKTHYETGIPRPTLQAWRDGSRRPVAPHVQAQEKEALARSCDKLARRMLRQANRKHKDMSASQAVVGAAILIEKTLLLRGEPTQITENQGDSELVALFREHYGKLRTGSTPATPLQLPDATTTPSAPLESQEPPY